MFPDLQGNEGEPFHFQAPLGRGGDACAPRPGGEDAKAAACPGPRSERQAHVGFAQKENISNEKSIHGRRFWGSFCLWGHTWHRGRGPSGVAGRAAGAGPLRRGKAAPRQTPESISLRRCDFCMRRISKILHFNSNTIKF